MPESVELLRQLNTYCLGHTYAYDTSDERATVEAYLEEWEEDMPQFPNKTYE